MVSKKGQIPPKTVSSFRAVPHYVSQHRISVLRCTGASYPANNTPYKKTYNVSLAIVKSGVPVGYLCVLGSKMTKAEALAISLCA